VTTLFCVLSACLLVYSWVVKRVISTPSRSALNMVHTSKYAILCPAPSCSFAYFACTPDPTAKLRNHFNNLKGRDKEHEEFFQKRFCLFCKKAIQSKSRNRVWKSSMNTHWITNHAAEFNDDTNMDSQVEMVCLEH